MRWSYVLVLALGGAGMFGCDGEDGPVVCQATQPGKYCGQNDVDNGNPSTLYTCPGPGEAPSASTSCPEGCIVEPPGNPDRCRPSSGGGYRLPWSPGTSMQLTQDCNDACCQDHIGTDRYAYDFANGGSWTILAARGGTVTHLKINSTNGCETSACVDQTNYIVIDHGDGTQATYLHLAGNSLAPGVTCGGAVTRGQPLAQAGTTGWSTGVHLHFQINGVRETAPTCECGADGRGCAANTVQWGNFWVNETYPSTEVIFDDWPEAAACSNRRIAMPQSQNE